MGHGVRRQDPPGSVQVSGEVDVASVEEVRIELEVVLRETGQLAIDTSGVTFMDSQGLRMLILLGEEAVKAGTTIQVINCSPQVQRLFEIAVPQGIPGVQIIKQ